MTDWQPSDPTLAQAASKPRGALRLGPMTLADIADNSFKLFKQDWKQIAIVVVILSLPFLIIDLVVYADRGETLTDALGGFEVDENGQITEGVVWDALLVGGLIVYGLLTVLVQPFAIAVITRIVAASYFGEGLSAGDSMRGLLRRWPAIVIATILVGLTLLGASMVVVVPVAGLAVISPFFLILLLGVVFPIVILSVLLALVIPVIAVEETGPAAALNRSWSLTRRRFWPYLGTLTVVWIVSMVAAMIVVGLLSGIQLVTDSWFTPLSYVVIAAQNFAGNLVIVPVVTTAVALLYFDARIRFEGLDLEIAAARQAQPPATPPTPPQQY